MKSYNKNAFQPAERRLQEFNNFLFWEGCLTHQMTPLAYGSVVSITAECIKVFI